MTFIQALIAGIAISAVCALVVLLLVRAALTRCPLCRRSWWPMRGRQELLTTMRDQRTGRNVIVHRYCAPFVDRPRTVLSPRAWRA